MGLSRADFIDDIFVDLSLAANGVATREATYSGVKPRVTARMTFRVDCKDNYYGDNCFVHCVAGNTFTCDEDDGSRICHHNYYGERCNVLCRDSNDLVRGFYTCDDDDGSRVCNDGYTGSLCTESE